MPRDVSAQCHAGALSARNERPPGPPRSVGRGGAEGSRTAAAYLNLIRGWARARRRPAPGARGGAAGDPDSLPGLARGPAPASRTSTGCAVLTLCLPGTGAARRGPVVSDAVGRAAERSERPPRTPQPGAREPELPGTRGCSTRGLRGLLCPRPLTREPKSRARLQPVAGRGNSWGWGGQLGREGGAPFSSSQ